MSLHLERRGPQRRFEPNFAFCTLPCKKIRGEMGKMSESQRSSVIVAGNKYVRFPKLRSFSKPATGVENWCQISHFWPLWTLGKGWAKCLTLFIVPHLGLNQWYTSHGAPLHRLGAWSPDFYKKFSGKTEDRLTIVGRPVNDSLHWPDSLR